MSTLQLPSNNWGPEGALVLVYRDDIKKQTSLLSDLNVSDIQKQTLCSNGHRLISDDPVASFLELWGTWERELDVEITEDMLEK